MKRRWILAAAAVVALAVLIFGTAPLRGEAAGGAAEVRRDRLEAWSVYDGSLESRNIVNLMSRLGGSATIVELVPEGAHVKAGDVLARFDASQFERDIVRLSRDHALAKAELEGLEKAKLPLELRDLEVRLSDARILLESEERYLTDSRQLLEEELISAQEVEQQERKVEGARKAAESLELQLDLTRSFLHPSALERARATLESAAQELRLAQETVSNCTVVAPNDGMVVYKAVHVGGEFRTARVGDTIYRNQPFLALPDMSRPVVLCSVPESELSLVAAGKTVAVSPLAYPDLRLKGTVESVGSMAQSIQGRPDWQRYFHVVIGLDENDARLRAGMSARVSILSLARDSALLVPRSAVSWESGSAYCEVVRGRRRTRREVTLGAANDQFVEVVSGLTEGERVLTR